MRRGVPEKVEEACGVWLDAAALKRRKVQTQLIPSGSKLLTLFPGERKTRISVTRRTPPTGIRQTSIASFFAVQPGKRDGDGKKSSSSLTGSQTSEGSKKEVTQPAHLSQRMPSPLATSTPAEMQETGLSPRSLQASEHLRMGTPILTVPSPDARESKACSFSQGLENSCLLDQKDSSCKRLHGSKTKNCQGMENRIKPLRKGHQLSAGTNLEHVHAKENMLSPVLQTCRGSWSGGHVEPVKQNPCPVPAFFCDNENDRESWSQLFTEDSQGQQVIAHGNARPPFQDVTNNPTQGLGRFLDCSWAGCQGGSTQLSLQSDVLFTQDSEGNQVIRHRI